MTIFFERHSNPDKEGILANAELHLDGALFGLRLIGFSIRETAVGHRVVLWPSRRYTAYGKRRQFSLLRPKGLDTEALDSLERWILNEFQRFERDERSYTGPVENRGPA